jgi:hypothetical protein
MGSKHIPAVRLTRTLLIILAAILVLSVLLMLPTLEASADEFNLSLMLEKAGQYIYDTQNSDGSWGSRLAVRDTALCAEGLFWQGGDTDAIDNALAWLSASEAMNSDFISRKAWCLAFAGVPATLSQDELDFLAACGHEDGSLSLIRISARKPRCSHRSYKYLAPLAC